MLFLFTICLFLDVSPTSPMVVLDSRSTRTSQAPPTAFAKVDQEVVLLRQDFESQTLPGWDLDDNTPGLPGWQHVFRSDAFSGRGYLEITGFDGEGFCTDKSKVLRTPEIGTVGLSQITVFVQVRIFNEQVTDPLNKFLSTLRLGGIPTDKVGKTGRVIFSSIKPKIQAMADGWELMTFTIPGAQIPSGFFSFFFTYTSTANACEIVQVDDFQVVGVVSGDGPETLIVEPPRLGGPRVVELGESVHFRATTAGGASGFGFEWLILDSETQQVLLTADGEEIDITFFQTGSFLVLCSAVDGLGRRDATPDFRALLVVPDRDLNTVILNPEEGAIDVARGSQVAFRAAVSGGGSDNVQFNWMVIGDDANRSVREFQGESVQIPFEENGRFTVLCQASDGVGFRDPSPARREVRVFGTHVKIIQPIAALRHKELVVPPGTTVAFKGAVINPENAIQGVTWMREPGRQEICRGSNDCNVTFDKAGFFAVSFVGTGKDGPLVSDFIRVVVGPRLYLQLLVPEQIVIQAGEPLVLEGKALGGSAGKAQVFWVFKGQIYPGNRAEIENLGERGQYQAKLVARLPGENTSISRTVRVDVEDANAPVEPVITNPRTSLTLPPGETVFFDSSLRKVPRSRQNPYWEIRDRMNGLLLKSGNTQTLGRVQFETAGVFDVELFLRSDQGNQLVDQREIIVAQLTGDSFGDNASLESAAEIDAGRYVDLPLDRAQYFEYILTEDGLNIVIELNLPASSRVLVFNTRNEEIFDDVLSGARTLQFNNLPAGSYKFGIFPDAGVAKLRANFSFSVGVLNPALYFTDITETQSYKTAVGIINPNGEDADVDIIGYDSSGAILDKLTRVISAQGSMRANATDLFPDFISALAWIRVDSTHDLVGFSHTISSDDLEGYAVTVPERLQTELFVPHIAQGIETWSTRASLVNGLAQAASPFLVAGETTLPLTNNSSFTKDSFDFFDKLGASISESSSWGRFYDENQSAGLAGSEVFGKVDGTRQIVGLGLNAGARDNGSLVADVNTLYFTHIANVENFWTGISLVNVGSQEQGAEFRAYDGNGGLLGSGQMTLASGEKLVELAPSLLAGLEIEGEAQWLEIIADADITGYELFGTYDTKQMAGLEAITTISTSLCFPFVEPGGGFWHGIALVNVSSQSASMTFKLFDDVGGEIISFTLPTPVLAKQKRIFLLTDLFGPLPLNASWLSVTSNREIAGFELFGNSVFEHMSGVVAQ